MDKPRDFGIALSGGGHRASLLAMGVLLYLVGSRANERVATVCSVSGGSITNAFVAQECDFGTVRQDEFDQVATKFVRIITGSSIVSLSSWAVRVYLFLVCVLGAPVLWFLFSRLVGLPSGSRVWVVPLLLLVLGLLLLLRGALISWLLGRAFFVNNEGQASRLGKLCNQTVGHVLCATDLTSAAPFYFLCGKEWAVYTPRYGYAHAGAMKLTSAVGASAALPGAIPPKLLFTARLNWAADLDAAPISLETGGTFKPRTWDRPPWLLSLADGGVWNNLATQYFERDQELNFPFLLLKPGASPSRPSDDPGKLIIVDGSGLIPPTTRWDFLVPLWAELHALARVMELLYVNTVQPRMRNLGEVKRAYWRWGDLFDLDWDIPKIGISISFDDNPQAGRIYMGFEFPNTEHSQACRNRIEALDTYRSELPKVICPALEGFPETSELALFCAKEKTHLGTVNRTRAAALLVFGYLSAMESMHAAYGTPLIRPFPSEERFIRLLPAER